MPKIFLMLLYFDERPLWHPLCCLDAPPVIKKIVWKQVEDIAQGLQ